jgi:hypothetical protein
MNGENPMRLLIAAALVALPAAAGAQEINHQIRVGNAARNGCTVQPVHTPAGKLVHSSPIVRCPSDAELARRADRTERQLASRAR